MSTLRAVATFILLLGILLLAIFQMQLRGYDRVARLNQYVLYVTDPVTCLDVTLTIDSEVLVIRCENAYLVTSGFSEYTIEDALLQERITITDIEDYVTID
jgi:hypothetical protein